MSRSTRAAKSDLAAAETHLAAVETSGHPEESAIWADANQRLTTAQQNPALPASLRHGPQLTARSSHRPHPNNNAGA
jgi:hypothetical protein